MWGSVRDRAQGARAWRELLCAMAALVWAMAVPAMTGVRGRDAPPQRARCPRYVSRRACAPMEPIDPTHHLPAKRDTMSSRR